MLTLLHEAPLLLMQERPTLLLDLLEHLGLTPPDFQEMSLDPAEHTEVLTLEGRSDKVATFYRVDASHPDPGARRQPVLGIINESQTDIDPDKWYTWPFYHAALRKKLRCPVWILVLTLEERVAAWARRPVPGYHPGSSFVPLVLGPAQIPVILDPVVAQGEPELAVLSAMVHGNDQPEVVRVALTSLRQLPRERQATYEQMLLAALKDQCIHLLQEYWMQISEEQWADVFDNTPGGRLFQQRYREIVANKARREGLDEGRREGSADNILTILLARGLTPTEQERQRILSCAELAQLESWLLRALTARSVAELF